MRHLILACLTTAPPIVIDGDFGDWSDVAPAVRDAADAAGCPADLGTVRVTNDDAYVYLLFELGAVVNLQKLDGSTRLVFDADGDPSTGHASHGLDGVDLVVEATAKDPRRPAEAGRGFAAFSSADGLDLDRHGTQRSVYDLDWMSAPTFAGRTAEVRLRRGPAWGDTPSLFTGRVLRGRLVLLDQRGRECDRTEIFTHTLVSTAAAIETDDDPDADPLDRAPGTTLRMLTWNVERGALLEQPEPFLNVIRAVDPDVILLQELRSSQNAEGVAEVLLGAQAPGDRRAWHVVFGRGGGNLRCAVASRREITPAEGLTLIDDLERENRPVRAVGATLAVGDRTVGLVSVHLTCCGRAGDDRDQRRVVEARSISDALARSPKAGALIIAGDYNAVGSGRCVELLAASNDLDGSALTDAPARQLDGRSMATWSDVDSPFGPGRLDYVLYSDSSLELLRSFVVDAADLDPAWLAHHGVNADDTLAASDHLPVVADFAWK